LGFTIIRETDEIVPFEPEKHEAMRIYFSMERDGKPKDEIEKAVDNAYTLYRVERLSIEMFEAIKDLHAKGWIKVEA
jgi:hypothetical protein